MKVYLVKEEDLKRLLTMIDRDPRHGHDGGSSQVFTREQEQAQHDAHRFYNYQVRNWIDEVRKD